MGPAASPAPAASALSDIIVKRNRLIEGTADKSGAKKVQMEELDINTASPPAIEAPFAINSDTPPGYTISFDIKVEKNLPMDTEYVILDRGGTGDDTNGQRPLVRLRTNSKDESRCAADITELQGLGGLNNFAGSQGSGGLNQVRLEIGRAHV